MSERKNRARNSEDLNQKFQQREKTCGGTGHQERAPPGADGAPSGHKAVYTAPSADSRIEPGDKSHEWRARDERTAVTTGLHGALIGALNRCGIHGCLAKNKCTSGSVWIQGLKFRRCTWGICRDIRILIKKQITESVSNLQDEFIKPN
jgi:hypothetical protein